MKVLVTAYACQPGVGSEPGIGWSWTRQIAQRHACTLVTRTNNVGAVRARARDEGLDQLKVVGHDLPAWVQKLKGGERFALPYFYLWQRTVGSVARRLDRTANYDLVHHLTFASIWMPSGLATLKKPFLWGPVGCHPRVPDAFLTLGRGARLTERAKEGLRGYLARQKSVRLTAARATRILSLGADGLALLDPVHRTKVVPLLACGVEAASLPATRFERGEGLRVLFAGRLVDLKGPRLALEAFARFAEASPDATMTFVGDGPLRATLERTVASRKLAERVRFTGRLSHDATLAEMKRADVFLFPSFEGGGMVVAEAMEHGCPVLCLDQGGPREMVRPERGVLVRRGRSFGDTAQALANSLTGLDGDEERRGKLARAAHAWAHANLVWDRKGEALERIYREVLAPFHERRREVRREKGPREDRAA